MIPSRTIRAFVILAALVSPSIAFTIKPPSPSGMGAMDDLRATSLDTNEDWNSLTQMIKSKIGAAEDKEGKPLSDEAKDEIIATALAGSALGTIVGSPLIIGAALGYAGTQMLSENQREQAQKVLGKASKNILEQANAAVAFSKEQLENEKDLSAASKKILLAIQEKASQVQNDIKSSPQEFMANIKGNVVKTVESEEFKSLPKNAFNAVRAFLESDEVKRATNSAMKAVKDGLESEEMKALQSRASQAMKDTLDSKKN
ncbi:hypothetical protein IV203_015550 [Nitzschia inconspicua]|uniref:Uncharacterized protein n=1 Tax=Nitzschia inconspicua TaxID=303405 RepID=A0A9K3PTK5_9STRA|nr:hypothetical protein IV203_015550 [Nitzschia inconspicua]